MIWSELESTSESELEWDKDGSLDTAHSSEAELEDVNIESKIVKASVIRRFEVRTVITVQHRQAEAWALITY